MEDRDLDRLVALVEENVRALRHVVGLTYKPEAELRELATSCLARVAKVHPDEMEEVVLRLVWAMHEEAATNGVTVPPVLRAIAQAEPALVLPMLPELFRLTKDPALRDGLAATIKILSQNFPEEVAQTLGETVTRLRGG